MSEQSVTYVDLRSHMPTEQKRKRRPKHTSITELSFHPYNWSEVSKQEVTYSELKFHTPSEQQRQQTPTSAGSKDCLSPSSPWRITVILGLLCLALLATSGALGAMFLQASDQVRKLNEELIQKQENFSQNFSQLTETLKNCTHQTHDLQAQKANVSKSENWTGDKCSSCAESWKRHKGKSYLFTNERRPWQESREYCLSCGSRLLKIENKEELNFINGLACFHWIGLSRTGPATSWMWEDGTTHSTDMFRVKIQQPGRVCAVLNAGEAFSYDCTSQYRCICEKRAA